MSIWAEVKKALNSTVGTTKFKPLNELYLDSRYMYASDNTILNYPKPDGSAYLYDEVYAKIHIPGGYRVIARIRSGTSDGIAKIIVKKGTSTIATYEESGLKNTEERTNFTLHYVLNKLNFIYLIRNLIEWILKSKKKYWNILKIIMKQH